jgi:hypothetical protein
MPHGFIIDQPKTGERANDAIPNANDAVSPRNDLRPPRNGCPLVSKFSSKKIEPVCSGSFKQFLI